MSDTAFTNEGPPLIDLGIVEKVEAERGRETEREMDALSDLPVQVKIGEKSYALAPPTAGKIRLVSKMMAGIMPRFEEMGKLLKQEDLSLGEATASLEKSFSENLDSFVDIVRILLEPNGKPIRLEALSISKDEIEWSLTSAAFQNIVREAFGLLDLFGLKKNLPVAAKG